MNQEHTKLQTLTLVGLVALFASCSRIEEVLESIQPDLTPHENYSKALERAGLAESALARAWQEASGTALDVALTIETPYLEFGYFAAERPEAIAYRIDLKRGQSLFVSVEVESEEPALVFLDLFRPIAASDGSPDQYQRITGADSNARRFEFEPSRDGEYIIRLQPELLHSVRFNIQLQKTASLAFPVQDHDTGAIRSGFGVARDGGRRSHHGVDIFAPRGTPVLAVSDGTVSRVRTGGLGGRHIWVRDTKRGLSLYYAHLDRQLAHTGQRVRAGDTLGLVGNTGNARTTPPHLHFGVYRRGEGPIDPFSYIHELPQEPPELQVDSGAFGEWFRTGREGNLRSSHSARSPKLATLTRHAMLRIRAGVGRWYRVQLPDGLTGFVIGDLIEAAEKPVSEVIAEASHGPIMEQPGGFLAVTTQEAGGKLSILGRFKEYLRVRSPTGVVGWVRDPTTRRRSVD
jgi:murein DD-endopeptidase MepM/ murein hydrolase activator NlpD